MQSPEGRKYLWDAWDAARRAQRFTDGRTSDNYQSDELLRLATERLFEIVGEAFRNQLIRGYQETSNELVWNTLTGDLPKLIAELQSLLENP